MKSPWWAFSTAISRGRIEATYAALSVFVNEIVLHGDQPWPN